ncbi:MAG: transcriptional repressor LexA [Bdellovibrionota bacterium]
MADRTKTETPKGTRKLGIIPKDTMSDVRAEGPKPLSLKEKNVLEFLETYMRENGVSPTYQEICKHFGFASFNSVQRYLKQLEAKGYIQLPWANQKRAITLLHPASAVQDAIVSRDDDSSSQDSVTPAIMPTESLSLPLLGRVAAGAPIEAVEHDEFIEVPASLVRHADRTYALRVQGQSMIDDGILDGDVILVQRQNTAQNGEITVAMIGEEATVKRFYTHRGAKNVPAAALTEMLERLGIETRNERALDASDSEGGAFANTTEFDKLIELRPANSTMAPMWFHPSEIQIRGVVVGLIRRFV